MESKERDELSDFILQAGCDDETHAQFMLLIDQYTAQQVAKAVKPYHQLEFAAEELVNNGFGNFALEDALESLQPPIQSQGDNNV